MDISSEIKHRMQELSISASELARRTHYSPQYIGDLLAGERRWNETTLGKVCEVLGFKLKLVDTTGTDG